MKFREYEEREKSKMKKISESCLNEAILLIAIISHHQFFLCSQWISLRCVRAVHIETILIDSYSRRDLKPIFSSRIQLYAQIEWKIVYLSIILHLLLLLSRDESLSFPLSVSLSLPQSLCLSRPSVHLERIHHRMSAACARDEVCTCA